VRWYRKAAEQGYAGAQYNLGVTYAIDQGVKQDVVEAVRLCRKAAEQGSVADIEGGEDVDDSERRGVEDVDGAAGADGADGARVSATSERTPDDMVGLEQQHEKSMRASRISTML